MKFIIMKLDNNKLELLSSLLLNQKVLNDKRFWSAFSASHVKPYCH